MFLVLTIRLIKRNIVQLTILLFGNIREVVGPETVLFLPVAEPDVTVVVDDQIAEVLCVEGMPCDVFRDVWIRRSISKDIKAQSWVDN